MALEFCCEEQRTRSFDRNDFGGEESTSSPLFSTFWRDLSELQSHLRNPGGNTSMSWSLVDISVGISGVAAGDGMPSIAFPRVELQVCSRPGAEAGSATHSPLGIEVSYLGCPPSEAVWGTGLVSSSSDDEHGEAVEDDVYVRPRVTSSISSVHVEQSGLLAMHVGTNAAKYGLAFGSILEVVSSLVSLLCEPAVVMDSTDLVTIPEDAELVSAWQNHAEWYGPGSMFERAMPCEWEHLMAQPDAAAKNALLEELKANLRSNIAAAKSGERDAAEERHKSISTAISGFGPKLSLPDTRNLFQTALPFDEAWAWEGILDAELLPVIPTLLQKHRAGGFSEKKYANALREAVQPLMKKEAEHVYSLPCFSTAFCNKLVAEMKNYESSEYPKFRPNSMNEHGIIVNEMGLRPFIDALCRVYFFPIAALCIPEFGGRNTLDHHHSFVVEYGEGRDVWLDMHIDDSETTFSVNLCDTFEGSSLALCGLTGAKNRRQVTLQYHHALGRVLLHAGSHRHGAQPISSGERYNLIVWGRSSLYREGAPKHGTDNCLCCQRHADEAPPDTVCLSMTWDEDYKVRKAAAHNDK